ncbi:MAG: hypothetical protein AAB873_01980, partial [Patescibacteria group bacterium]
FRAGLRSPVVFMTASSYSKPKVPSFATAIERATGVVGETSAGEKSAGEEREKSSDPAMKELPDALSTSPMYALA